MIEGQEDVSWDQWVALAETAERSGFEALFRSDHYLSVQGRGERGSLDAWSTINALATRIGSQPVMVGFPEKPCPGREGITTSNASASVPPYAVGSVNGPMILSCSMIDPGQPCVMMIGNAFACLDRM